MAAGRDAFKAASARTGRLAISRLFIMWQRANIMPQLVSAKRDAIGAEMLQKKSVLPPGRVWMFSWIP
jgi:hypothetical protein